MFTNRLRYLHWLLPLLAAGLLSGCENPSGHMGTLRIPDSFSSNGERIYFTGISERSNTPLTSSGASMPMMRNSCASCHGADRQGGIRMMPYFWVKTPPLLAEALFGKPLTEQPHTDKHGDHGVYDDASLREAILHGRDPSGETLNRQMPRWRMSEPDMRDLIAYLRS